MPTPSYRHYTGSAAEKYQRYFVPAIATPVSGALLEAVRLQPGERVLDVACGTGVIARLAAELVEPTGSVSGVDVSPDMIDVAKNTPAPAAPHIDWHVGDAASLPLPDAAFEAVLCQMGLMFIEDRAAALAEMRRVLAAGGRVAVNTPGAIQPVFQLMEQAIVEHIGPELGGFVRAVFSMHDPDGLASLLDGTGFTNVSVNVSTATLQLPAPTDFLWQYINLTPIGLFVAQADEGRQAAMEHQVVESWQPFVVDGRLRVDQPMVIALARR